MRDEIKTTWFIAVLLIGMMGVFSLFSSGIEAQAQKEITSASVGVEHNIAKSSNAAEGFCGWLGNLFTSS
ncbi:MAG: hypothetical protein NXI13_15705 [Proteobacteria bacterium]|nr:hypothetical protein [Pseudomonadota bacterium]